MKKNRRINLSCRRPYRERGNGPNNQTQGNEMMIIYNVIEFGGDDGRLPDPNRPTTWQGKTFVLVRGAMDDFAIYWKWTLHGYTPHEIAVGGDKVPSFKLPNSDLSGVMQKGLIEGMPEGWYYRA